jgi:hypothetical protein
MILNQQLDIGAPIEQAFSWIYDPDKQKEWINGLTDTIWITPFNPEDPVGSQFKRRIQHDNRQLEREGEVIEFYRPNIYGVRINDPRLPYEEVFRLEPLTTRSCRLHYKRTIASHTLLSKAVATMMLMSARGQIKKQLKNLVHLIENGAK